MLRAQISARTHRLPIHFLNYISALESGSNRRASWIDFVDNDRGEIEAATRDALRADRGMARGARLLRAASRALAGR